MLLSSVAIDRVLDIRLEEEVWLGEAGPKENRSLHSFRCFFHIPRAFWLTCFFVPCSAHESCGRVRYQGQVSIYHSFRLSKIARHWRHRVGEGEMGIVSIAGGLTPLYQ